MKYYSSFDIFSPKHLKMEEPFFSCRLYKNRWLARWWMVLADPCSRTLLEYLVFL